MKRVLVWAALLWIGTASASEERIIHLYNWSDYMTDEVLEMFKKETGIEVQSDYFASNEELMAKLQAGAFAYDIVFPSDYYVKVLIKQDLLQPLDAKKLSNLKHLDPKFLNPTYDPENKHSVPYFFGTTGLAYRSSRIPGGVTSWKVLYDPKWKRKVNMLDDMREVIGSALRIQGHTINSRNPTEIRQAAEQAIEQKKIVRTYSSSSYREILNAGDVWLTQGFSNEMVLLRRENPDIAYVIPEEGATLFTDNMVIPARAKHVEEAHLFINFILRPEISAKLAEALLAGTPNKDARPLLPEAIRNDKAIYPPEEILKKCEYVEDVGPALKQYEEVWIDLKTR